MILTRGIIQLHTQIPVSHQNLLFSPNPHRVLLNSQNPDSILLSQLHITPYSTLFLHVPLRGDTQPGPGGAAAPPKPRLDFLNSKPPPNYVVELSRGATGFTTRSAIGPARAAPDLPDRSATAIGGAVATSGLGRGRGKPGEDEEADKGYDENQKFDEFERCIRVLQREWLVIDREALDEGG